MKQKIKSTYKNVTAKKLYEEAWNKSWRKHGL
jgi:hypothetical protein